MKKQAFFSLVLFFAACGASTDDPDPVTVESGLAADYGGQTMAAEPEAVLGDEAVEALGAEAPATDDALVRTEDIAGLHRVRVLVGWGYFHPHRDATESVVWDGSLSVTGAVLRLVRTVKFEPETDAVLPRTDRSSIEFTSITLPHWDGLIVDVVFPAASDPNAPVVLTLDTAAGSASITIERGMRGTQITRVDEAGHHIGFHVIRPDGDGCAEGFLLGRWQVLARLAGHEVGVFFGRFLDSDGNPIGLVRGIFGQRRNGAQVFFGKVIGPEGNARALMAGRYGEGHFAGRLLGQDREVLGALRGRYGDRDHDGDGFFAGRWSRLCGERTDEGRPDAGDEAAEDLSRE